MRYGSRREVGMKALIPLPGQETWSYLLVRRSLEFEGEDKEQWELPGGRVGPAEGDITWQDGLKREISEETNLNVLADRPNVPILFRRQLIQRNAGRPDVIRFTYLTQVAVGSVALSHEHSSYMYANRTGALRLENLDPVVREVLQDDHLFAFENHIPATADLNTVRNTMFV